ncbi:hypothetical protein [Mycolicibacterium sp. P1-5]|uniref:hypothetical protein n=1 Tax=Mycolicibacterium sp. P1-5 TaxID=2024617 RepID=UPI001D1434DC|nr:hypothetical protein [Mycolicibacterium sp. P1-5]
MTPTTDQPRDTHSRVPIALSAAVLATIVLITAIAPLATDMYMLGFLHWCTAGVIAPLAGLGGAETAVPMAAIVTVLAVATGAALRVLDRPDAAQTARS